MKKIAIATCLLFLPAVFLLAAPPFASWNKTTLTLNNGLVERIIQLPVSSGPFITSSYKPVDGTFGYFQKTNPDFQFEWNDKIYSGRTGWQLLSIMYSRDKNQGGGASVILLSQDKKLQVTVTYLLYPNSPAIRKSLAIKNVSAEKGRLESVDIEKFDLTSMVFVWIMSDYGRRKSIGPFEGGRQDALVTLHNINTRQGMIIGNEASGVMKRTSVLWDAPELCSGFTHKDAVYPFRKWIKVNDSFQTPQVFTMVYNNEKDPDAIMNTAVPDFVRKYMGIRLSVLDQKPTFVYNTWVPFRKNINEQLIKELAKSAADAGMKEFIIDDGWQDGYGDWGIDQQKFPHGLKPVFDYIKSLGMKPGLWVSIGSAAPNSKVFKEHPEWFVKDKNNQFTSLHSLEEKDKTRLVFPRAGMVI